MKGIIDKKIKKTAVNVVALIGIFLLSLTSLYTYYNVYADDSSSIVEVVKTIRPGEEDAYNDSFSVVQVNKNELRYSTYSKQIKGKKSSLAKKIVLEEAFFINLDLATVENQKVDLKIKLNKKYGSKYKVARFSNKYDGTVAQKMDVLKNAQIKGNKLEIKSVDAMGCFVVYKESVNALVIIIPILLILLLLILIFFIIKGMKKNKGNKDDLSYNAQEDDSNDDIAEDVNSEDTLIFLEENSDDESDYVLEEVEYNDSEQVVDNEEDNEEVEEPQENIVIEEEPIVVEEPEEVVDDIAEEDEEEDDNVDVDTLLTQLDSSGDESEEDSDDEDDDEEDAPKTAVVKERVRRKLDPIVRAYFHVIKNSILQHKKVKERYSARYNSFYTGRVTRIKICANYKTLKVYLALNPEEVTYNYKIKDVSNKKIFAQTPVLIKVRSKKSLDQAMELIDLALADFEKDPKYKEKDYSTANFAYNIYGDVKDKYRKK